MVDPDDVALSLTRQCRLVDRFLQRAAAALVARGPDAQRGVHSGGYSGTGALPRPITARGGLTYDPGLHLNLAAELSEGWGPPLS